MANRNGVVLSGIGEYSKVQSLELRAFASQSPEVVSEVTTKTSTIEDIKKSLQNPKTDNFPLSMLQIPESIEELIAETQNDEDDENSSEISE